jgi:hypothetical protein
MTFHAHRAAQYRSLAVSDFLTAIADHLDRTPSLCPCGHPSVLHADGFGCTARFTHDSGSDVCPCEEGC